MQSFPEEDPPTIESAIVRSAGNPAPVVEGGDSVPPSAARSPDATEVPPNRIGPSEITSGDRTDFIYHRLLAISDLLAILLAAGISVLVFAGGRTLDTTAIVATLTLMIPVWFVIAYGAGLYHEVEWRIDFSYVDELGSVVITATAWCWLFVMLRALLADGATELAVPALIWALMIPSILFARAVVRHLARRQSWNRRQVAIIGDRAGVESLTTRIDRHAEWNLDIKLSVEVNGEGEFLIREPGSTDLNVVVPEPYLGEKSEVEEAAKETILADILKDAGADRAIISSQFPDLESRNKLIHELINRGVALDHVFGGAETHYSNATVHKLEGLPVASMRPTITKPFARRIKRLVDIGLSLIGLSLLSPLFLWAAIRIKLDSNGPVFYRQVRCGLDGAAFELCKFRTMVDGAHDQREELRERTENLGNDDVLFKLHDDPRITKAGRTIRRYSIDELPQFWNVLKGDMSMVGPRPLVFEEAIQATDIFTARIRVKPGIAGPWQALGRSSIPFEDMIRLDYAYVAGWSMTEDLKLLLRTLNAVTKGTGAV